MSRLVNEIVETANELLQNKKILSKFGFKRMWFERHGNHMQLWGEFNSKVLLMDKEVHGNQIYRLESDIEGAGRVGSKYGENGIVLDETGNQFSRNVALIDQQEALADVFKRLDNMSDTDRLKKIQTGNPYVSTRMDWDSHEKAVHNNLAATHPGQRSAQQVTFDLYDKDGKIITTIRADNAVLDKFGNITIVDAKHQANAEIARGVRKPINTVTDNQSIGYPAIKNGNVGKAVPRGDGASKLGILEREVTINPRIEIHTNNLQGNIIRMDLDGKIIN